MKWNDLFDIKLIFLRSELYVAIFSICMDSTFFGTSRFFYNFLSIEDAIDREVWLEAIKSD